MILSYAKNAVFGTIDTHMMECQKDNILSFDSVSLRQAAGQVFEELPERNAMWFHRKVKNGLRPFGVPTFFLLDSVCQYSLALSAHFAHGSDRIIKRKEPRGATRRA